MPSLLVLLAGAAEDVPPRAVAAEAAAAGRPPAVTAAAPDALAAPVVRADADLPQLRAASEDADFLAAAGRLRDACERLNAALAAAGPGVPAADRARAAAQLARLQRLAADDEDRRAQGTRLAAQDRGQAGAAQEAGQEGSIRQELFDRIAELAAREHLELALAQARRLWRLLPDDAEAEDVYRRLLDRVHTARRIKGEERERELRLELAAHLERSLLPEGHDGRPVFAADWTQRRLGRSSVLELGERPPAWKTAILDRLAARVDLRLDAMPAPDAFALVARLGGINMVVDPAVIAAADRLVTLKAGGMRLDNVLSWVCEQAGTRWSLLNHALYVGDQGGEAPITTLHDISALLLAPPDFPGKQIALGNGEQAAFVAAEGEQAKGVAAEDIVDLIRKSVSPATWADAANNLTVHENALVVTAPEAVQRLVREFLRAQNAQNAVSVRIDVRWLTLYDRFVEEIGVNWRATPGQLNSPPVRDTTNGGGIDYHRGGWNVEGGSLNQMPATAMSIQPATAGSGLQLQSALIGSDQFSAIVNAVERTGDGRVLAAPELTCMHGQLANCFFGNQAAYISDYEIVSSNYDPVISVLNTGTTLEVRPLVSADRRYVTLNLRTAHATVTFFTESIAAQYVPPGQGNTVDPITGEPIPLVAFTSGYPLDLPNVAVQELATAVMLPDRGSMIVGGFAHSLDQFAATRVPLLGSVPFLGRLFGARGRYHDRSRLFAITTVNIINYPELEARL